jgi:uncharacterized iron-regulated membrane protein
MTRGFWVVVHRYAGLTMALFLVVTGVTGSAIAFYPELDEWLNPALYRAAPRAPGAVPLAPAALRAALERQVPGATTSYVPLRHVPGRAIPLFVEPVTSAGDAAPPLEYDEYFIDPYTGAVLGGRRWGDIGQGIGNLMPFLYRLHYALALESVGGYLLGVVALVWTADCFVGAYLTFPLRARQSGHAAPGRTPKSWWRRWRHAWAVRWSGGAYRLNFDLHRAGGLWLWAILFVFAWSSVGLNLGEVYRPVMKAAFAMEDVYDTIPKAAAERGPALDWDGAHRAGQTLIAAEAARRDFAVVEPSVLGYDAGKHLFYYRVRSSLDISARDPATVVWLDATTGALVAFDSPASDPPGNTITKWLYALHFGAVWGLPFRIFICLMGLAVAVLSGTGIWIWWKKRYARRQRNAKRRLQL